MISNIVKPVLSDDPLGLITHPYIQVEGFAHLRVNQGTGDGERAKYLSHDKVTNCLQQPSCVKRKEVKANLPSLTTLSSVSRFQDLSNALMSWQLISHAFSKSQTPKIWGLQGSFPSQISIDIQLQPKKTVIAELLARTSEVPQLRKFGKLTIREIMTSAYVLPYTLWARVGGEGRESGVSPSGGGVCHIFLAGNRALHLCNPRFSWREIAQEMAWPLSSRSKTCFQLFRSIRIL